MEKLLKGLNDAQKEAVVSTEGPLLVLAGAGTGKTKTLTSRIAYIIKSDLAHASQILALTFTNKAAKELQDRVFSMLNYDENTFMWVGTFHSIGLKILKQHYDNLGLSSRWFSIYGPEQSQEVMGGVLEGLNLDPDKSTVRNLTSLIAQFKDKALFPEDITSNHNIKLTSNLGEQVNVSLGKIYENYNQILLNNNAVDLNDLLLLCIKLFKQFPAILKGYQQKFKYILVDEYQDTNGCQYQLLNLLAKSSGNLCCVGDDDQSIYGWRGADVGNILSFSQDYRDAKVVKLEENYRSTEAILAVANVLIANNANRWDKNMWTSRKGGDPVEIAECEDSYDEARNVAKSIVEHIAKGYQYKDIAVLVRAGYQTRIIEKIFTSGQYGIIPYEVVKATSFYDRQEVKDFLSYLTLVVNYQDNAAFKRIINLPKRGVGAAAFKKIEQVALQEGIPWFKATKLLLTTGAFSSAVTESLREFIDLIEDLAAKVDVLSPEELAKDLLERSGYLNMWQKEAEKEALSAKKSSPPATERLENLQEVINAVSEHEDLSLYLDNVNLLISANKSTDDNRVTIMTLHAAKGLEFKVVFLVGWIEGIFPSARSVNEGGNESLDEERRLAYVGITRAKQKLYIFYNKINRSFGAPQAADPSRFIRELKKIKNSSYITWKLADNSNSNYTSRFITKSEMNQRSYDNGYSNSGTTYKFKVGDTVEHAQFGLGVVLEVKGVSLRIKFRDSEENIVSSFVKIWL